MQLIQVGAVFGKVNNYEALDSAESKERSKMVGTKGGGCENQCHISVFK
jgi:hypothetical protein